MKDRLLVKHLITQAYVNLDTWSDTQTALALMKRAIELLEKNRA